MVGGEKDWQPAQVAALIFRCKKAGGRIEKEKIFPATREKLVGAIVAATPAQKRKGGDKKDGLFPRVERKGTNKKGEKDGCSRRASH